MVSWTGHRFKVKLGITYEINILDVICCYKKNKPEGEKRLAKEKWYSLENRHRRNTYGFKSNNSYQNMESSII